MSPVEPGILRGLATLLALLAFAGVVWWAWSGRRKQQFDRAAHMPLEEDLDKNEDN
ncbi:MAG TPA: CcoQ/FixQ family Cbb3-type cytochrome c oxidase assembly chaperone [Steroidobacteraceae bacterium]|nr:CcoQ/FixQ family Cbb3-type cytochrome c oxidase assembly chaperone [Steroidobacteraceae bacterium]